MFGQAETLAHFAHPDRRPGLAIATTITGEPDNGARWASPSLRITAGTNPGDPIACRRHW